jgi:transposase
VKDNKQRLHKVGYFHELLSANQEVQPCIRSLLKINRETIERCQKTEYALVSSLQRDPMLAERIKRLRTIPGVGPITALTWALEIGDVSRFQTIKQAISYCGLCGEELCRQDDANASFQTTQQAYPARADRSCKAGAETELRAGPGS